MTRLPFAFCAFFLSLCANFLYADVSTSKMDQELHLRLFNGKNPWTLSAKDLIDANGFKDFPSDHGKPVTIYSGYFKDSISLGCDLKQLSITEKNSKVVEIKLVFANRGDSAADHEKNTEKAVQTDIRQDFQKLKKRLNDLLGAGGTVSMNNLDGTKDKTPCWTYKKDTLFLLDSEKDAYVILKIIPKSAFGNNNPSEKKIRRIVDNYQGKRHLKVDRSMGDIWISGIPEVDQGTKGYCAAASLERVFKLYGIQTIDQHQIADKANVNVGGGITSPAIIQCASEYGKQLGFSVIGIQFGFSQIAKVIDQGYPLMWTMFSGDLFEKYAESRNLKRQEAKKLSSWSKVLHKEQKSFEPEKENGHLCLIIGYNKTTKEIAISNSYGSRGTLWWIPWEIAKDIHSDTIFFLNPN